jgi:uncharacterized protein
VAGARRGAAQPRAAVDRAEQGGGRLSAPVLILPGLGDSGPDHWQSHWERRDPDCRRVIQDEWDSPVCDSWVSRLGGELERAETPVVLAAHSAGCALVAHWAAQATPRAQRAVQGALLVAPSDPSGPNYPREPVGFDPMPMRRLPFRAIVVASDDDPYVSLERAREYAGAWGAALVMLGKAGHINVASGHGPWAEGYELLARLRHAPLEHLDAIRLRPYA